MNGPVRRQPKGLYTLFFTELWERFGYYMVSTILVLYLSKRLSFTDTSAYLLYGAFSSMLYLMPVIGGFIADRFIGFRQSIALGGFLFMIGYALMAIPDERWLYIGLSVVIIGNGFFKPNVSSMVGDLYEAHDPRRDGGFTLFYMGINIGALLPPIFAGALVAAYFWRAGFIVSSLGMIVSLITFGLGLRRVGNAGAVPSGSPILKNSGYKITFYFLLALGIFVVTAILHLLLYHPTEANVILVVASIGIIAAVLFFLFKELPDQRRKMFACLILITLAVGFWAVYVQSFTSLMLFADRNMIHELLGFQINTEFTQFFNPFFIIILSPFLSWLWVRLDETGKNPSTPLKFSIGILCMAIGFLILATGIVAVNDDGKASPWWLICSYFFQTVGELLISPIGLAMVTRLAPKHLVGMMMGVWFLTTAAAFAIGGGLATLSDVPEDVTGVASLEIYSHAFYIYGTISLVLAVLSFALIPFLKRLIGPTTVPIISPKR